MQTEMTNKYAVLRRVAEAATPGPWSECGHSRGGCSCGMVWSRAADLPVAEAWGGDEEAPEPSEGARANAAFIAAANPSNILSLLDELEAKAKTLRDLKWRIEDISAQLTARHGGDGESFYGLDEWSVPIRNLACAVDVINAAMQEQKP